MALGRFETILTGVHCQGIVGHKGEGTILSPYKSQSIGVRPAKQGILWALNEINTNKLWGSNSRGNVLTKSQTQLKSKPPVIIICLEVRLTTSCLLLY